MKGLKNYLKIYTGRSRDTWVQSTAHQTIHFRFCNALIKGISDNIELQVYSVTSCWPYMVTLDPMHRTKPTVVGWCPELSNEIFFFLPLSHEVRSVHVFYHVVIRIRQLFLGPAACLMSCWNTHVETGVGAFLLITRNCKCNRDQRLNVPSEEERSSR
jgi:hypothetical protein